MRSFRRITSVALVAAAAMTAAILAAGCGGSDGDADAAVESEAAARATTVYFLTEDGRAPLGVRRTLGTGEPTAEQAVTELLSGPRDDDRRLSLTTALNGDLRLESLEIGIKTGDAVVRLNGVRPPNDPVTRVQMITQITRTLVGLQGIDEVRIFLDGLPLALWRQDGRTVSQAFGYDDLRGFFGVCTGQPGADRGQRCFSALP